MARNDHSVKQKRHLLPQKNAYRVLLIAMMLIGVAFFVMLILVDAFPANMVVGFIVILFFFLIATSVLCARERKNLRIAGVVVAVLFMLIYGLGIYYLSTTYTAFARITRSDSDAAVAAQEVNVIEEPFNVYITGIDQWNVEKGMDLERSDVNMIVTVSPQTRKVLLTSIPRDAYVPLHRTGTMDKLTHTGIYGVDETLNTIKDWTGVDMNYYVKVNFNTCVDVIDAIGGVDVYSPVAFKSSVTSCKYKKGWNHLGGRYALYFARERHAFNGEDQLRVNNQLRVIKAMLKKMMSSSALLTHYGDVMAAISDEMETNMPDESIQALVKMQLSDLSTWDIETQRMSGKYEDEVVASMDASNKYTVLKISNKTFKSCLKNIHKTMNPSADEIAKAVAARQKNSVIAFLKSIKK